MSSRLGKLAGLKPPPAPSDPGAAAAAPATTPGSVASSPFMKPSAPAEPAASPAVTPVTSPVAKPAGGASSFGLAGKKMPMFKSITAAPPPPPPENSTPTSSSVNPLASPTPQPSSPGPMAPLASPNNSTYTNGYHSPAPAAPLSPAPSPVTPLNLTAAPAAAPPMVSPNFSHLGAPPPPPPGSEEIEPMAPPSPKPMQEWSTPAPAPAPAPVAAPSPTPAGGYGAKSGTPSKIAQMLGTSTAPPAPVPAPPPEEPKASKLAMIKNAAKPPPAPAASPSDPSTWNFDDDDNETNIVFSDDDPEKMHIKGATLCKLVQWLTYEKYRESEYLMGFLLTYRSFTTAFDLVEILKLRYVWVPANLKDKDEKSPEMDDFRKNRQLPIRIRILNVFRHWITHLFYDFQGEQGKLLGQKVLEFFDQHVITSMEKMGAPIKIALQKKLANNGEEKEGVPIFSPGTKFPTPIIPVNITTLGFMDINFEEIARQLTLIESDYYKAIKPWECLGQAWTKSDKAVRAPNVLRFIHRFNQVSKWVAAEIVRVENLKTRVSVLGHAIQIANKCLELRNLNACMAVMSGLQSTAVFRLKQTWAGLPKNQTKMFEDIHAIVSSQKSFGRMREMLKTIEAPCIPYLGMYLTDLIFLEDGMPNHLAGTNLINYYKRRKQAEVIMMIQRYQQSPFALEPVSFIQEYLLGVPVPDEEELYNQSLLREEKQTTTGGAAGAPKKDDKKKEPEKPKAPEAAPAKPAPAAGKPAAAAPLSGVSAKGAAATTAGAVGKPGEADEFGELDMPEGYPFAQPDGPQNITFCKDSSIKAATLTKLVERMTFEKYTDVAILTAFLMTYRDYATPLEILELLIQRYNVPRPRNAAPDVLQRFTTVKEVPIHLRIFNFMKNWIEKYWVDFYEDGDLRETFIEFIDNQFSGSMEKAAETLRRNLQKNLEAGPEGFRDVAVMPQKPPLPYQPPSFLQADPQMTDFIPEEIARQLSLQMFEIYSAIRPREFLSYLRCVGDPIKTYEVAPNIVRFLRFTTQLRMWLLSAILRHREPRLRALVITHAIKMLEKLDEFNNWNCANEIVTALNQDYIRKMAKTWDAVSKELIAVVERVQANSVLTRMRARVAVAQPPCIPWVEPYMAQLKSIHGKRPDQLEGGLINFKKKRELATLILEFQLFQNRQPYCYEVVPIISEHLRRALESSPVDDNQMMQLAGQYTVEEIQEIHNPGAVATGTGASRAAAPLSTADSTAKTKNILAKFKSAGTGSGAPPAPSEARAGAGAAAAVALVTPTHSTSGMSGTGSPFVNPPPTPAPGASYPTYMQSSPHSSGTFTSQQIASQSHTPPTAGTPTGTLRREDGYDSHGRSSGQSLASAHFGAPAPQAEAPAMERRRTASLVSSLMNDKDVKAVMRSLFTDEVKAALEKQKAQLTQSMKAEIQAAVNEEVEAWKARVKDHVTLLASRVQIVPDAEVQAAASIIISRCFPSGTVTEWKVEDPNGAIFGWPDEVRYNLVQEGEEQTLVAVLPHVAKSDVSIWLRSYRYYQQCFPTPNLQSAIITPSIAPDAAAAAAANGIRVLQLVL